MDPDATWALITDESNDLDERAVAATDLLCWLANLGHRPTNALTHDGFALTYHEIIDRCRYRIFKALDRLAELEEAEGDREAQIAESKTRHPASR